MSDSEALSTSAVLGDPAAQASARVYANAYLGAAGDQAGEAIEELNSFVTEVLNAHPQFGNLLTSKLVSRDDKLGLIDRAVASQGSPRFVNFLKTLASHDRLIPGFVPLVAQEAQAMHDAAQGRKRVQVRTAKPLDDGALNQIRDRLRSSFSFEPILEVEMVPELLGGMILQVDDTVYDSSLRTRLKQLRESLRERSNHVIQSERDRFGHPEGN